MASINSYEAFEYQWKAWRLTGLDPPEGRTKRLFYIFYSLCLNTFSALLFAVSLIVNCFFVTSVKELCENLTLTVTDVMCNLKLMNVLIKKQKLLQVEDILKRLDGRSSDAEEERIILRGAIVLSHRFFFVFLSLYMFTILASLSMLLFANERDLMYPAWIPLDWKHSTMDNVLANAYQMFALIVQGIQDVANDTYPQAYLSILCSHIRVLSIRVNKIKAGHEGDLRTNYQKLVACIKDHQDILRLYSIIQETLSLACLAQFLSSGLVQCTIGVYCLYLGFNVSKLMTMAAFFFAVTLEIYVLCYFGNQLLCESQKFAEAVYSCCWTDQSREFKTSLLILMQRSQKFAVITACGVIPVTLPTFLKVLKTAYSFFAVLNKVK